MNSRRSLLAVTFLGLFGLVGAATVAFSAPPPPMPLTLDLESYPYPFPVHYFPIHGEGQELRMAYMDVPPKAAATANGRVVVLLHGKNFTGYSPYWDNVIDALTDAGYRVIVPDQIGWGKSSKPDMPYRFAWLAANTAALLDSLHVGAVVLVGHSTGGMLAAHFALIYPNRVSQLVLEDPIGLEDYSLKVPPQPDSALYEAELKNTDPQKITAFFTHYFATPQPDLVARLTAVPIGVTLGPDYPRWAKASARAYQMIYTQPVVAQFPKISMPTLLVVGDKDHAAPLASFATPDVQKTMGHMAELAQEDVKMLPNGRLVIVRECGHIPHLEHPEVFKEALLSFLAEGGGK